MREQFNPPEDFGLEHADQGELRFEPVMTQEVLFDPEVRRRAEVLADRASGKGSSEVVPVGDVDILPPVLEVEMDTRKALIRFWIIMGTLSLVTLVQFALLVGLWNREPILIYADPPSKPLVQPWR